mmetsp:Transcript_43677/g.81553  ORF Transcript_43677/g.81553 Transcript_43677/m.81553 type:complete len:541 (+) Transcript_43677:52-1674(+)
MYLAAFQINSAKREQSRRRKAQSLAPRKISLPFEKNSESIIPLKPLLNVGSTDTSEANHVLDKPGPANSTVVPNFLDVKPQPVLATANTALATANTARQLKQPTALKRSKSMAPSRRTLKESFNLNGNSSDEDADKRKSASGAAVQKNWEIEDLFEFDVDRLVGVARSTAWGVKGDLSKGRDGKPAEGRDTDVDDQTPGEPADDQTQGKPAEGNQQDARDQIEDASELERLRKECDSRGRQIERLRRAVCELLVWGQQLQAGSATLNSGGAPTPAVTQMRSEAPEFVPLGISWALSESLSAEQAVDLPSKQTPESPPPAQASTALIPQSSPSPPTASSLQQTPTAPTSSQGQTVNALSSSVQPACMPQPSPYPHPAEQTSGPPGKHSARPLPPFAQPISLSAIQSSSQLTLLQRAENLRNSLNNSGQPAFMPQSSTYPYSTFVNRSYDLGGMGALSQGQSGAVSKMDASVCGIQSSVGLLGVAASSQQSHADASPVGCNASPTFSTEARANVAGKGRGRRGKSRRARRSQSMLPRTDVGQ